MELKQKVIKTGDAYASIWEQAAKDLVATQETIMQATKDQDEKDYMEWQLDSSEDR